MLKADDIPKNSGCGTLDPSHAKPLTRQGQGTKSRRARPWDQTLGVKINHETTGFVGAIIKNDIYIYIYIV